MLCIQYFRGHEYSAEAAHDWHTFGEFLMRENPEGDYSDERRDSLLDRVLSYYPRNWLDAAGVLTNGQVPSYMRTHLPAFLECPCETFIGVRSRKISKPISRPNDIDPDFFRRVPNGARPKLVDVHLVFSCHLCAASFATNYGFRLRAYRFEGAGTLKTPILYKLPRNLGVCQSCDKISDEEIDRLEADLRGKPPTIRKRVSA